jgi:hypothetical protein
MNPNIRFPGEPLLSTVVEGARQLGLSGTGHVAHIVWAKEMVKKQHVIIPNASCPLDIKKSWSFIFIALVHYPIILIITVNAPRDKISGAYSYH